MRVYRFTVTGRGSFPFEMLYRSAAYPATLEDAQKMIYACPTQAPALTITFETQKEISGLTRQMWLEEKWPISLIG